MREDDVNGILDVVSILLSQESDVISVDRCDDLLS